MMKLCYIVEEIPTQTAGGAKYRRDEQVKCRERRHWLISVETQSAQDDNWLSRFEMETGISINPLCNPLTAGTAARESAVSLLVRTDMNYWTS